MSVSDAKDDTSSLEEPWGTASVNTSSYPTLFNREDGDIVLESSDGVQFRVHRLLLREASSIFADMLSIPQPQPSSDEHVVMAEPANIVNVLLHYIYPTTHQFNITSLPFITEALTAAEDKYFMEVAVQPLKSIRRDLILAKNNPLQAWTLAVSHGDEQARRIAVRRCVLAESSVVTTRIKELATVDALAYYDLLDFRRRAVEAGQFAIQNVLGLDTSLPTRDVKGVFLSRAKGQNPFDEALTSEASFEVCYLEADAKSAFGTRKSRHARVMLRSKLKDLLETFCPV